MPYTIPFSAVTNVLSALKAEAADGAPVCVAIVNRTGQLAAFLSMDDAPERAGAIARAKAHTAMRMEMPTDQFHERILKEGLSVSDFCDPMFTTLAGGVPVCNADGRCIGGLGISGRKPHEDAALATRLATLLEQYASA